MSLNICRLIYIKNIYYRNNPEECDISTWYARVSSEGLFDRSMSIKQRKTHDTVKNILGQGRRRLVQCHILQAFENDLKKGGNERHAETEKMDMAQNGGLPKPLPKDKMEGVGHTATELNKKMAREGHTTIISKEKPDHEPTVTNSKQEEESSTTESQEKDKDFKLSMTKANKEKLQEKEMEDNQSIVQKEDDSNIDSTIHIQSSIHENELDMNNSSASITKDEEITLANNNEEDETELEDEEDEERNGGDPENDDKQRGDEDNDEYGEETNTAQNSYLSSSQFHSYDTTDKSAKRNNETRNDTLPNERNCKRFTWSFQRHLVLKTSPSEEGYTQNQRLIGPSCQASYVISPTYCGLRRRNSLENNLRQNVTILQQDQNGLSENEDKVPTKSITKELKEKYNDIPNVEIEQTEKKEEGENDVAISVDGRDGNAKYNSFKQRRTVLHNTLSNIQEDTMKSIENLKFHETSNIEQLKLLVSSKTEEYTKKIHFLELNLIKLENQMLMEKLNKENHSSTIARLENSILRLENELLRMRQNFQHMKIDNDEMKKTQRKYLELGHTSENHSLQRQNNRDEMLLEQQKTITMLSEKLQNQSDIILRLKNRSEHIDDQNRILHSLIINQTTLVSQIMAKVQALTEQSLQQQQEAKEMKEQLKYGLANVEAMKNSKAKQQEKELTINANQLTSEDLSQQLLQQLDDLVSDKKLEGAENVHVMHPIDELNGVEDEVDEQLKQYLHFASVSHLLKPDHWCDSPVYCYKGIITLSDCIPYSFVIYFICEVQSEKHNSEKDNQENIRMLEHGDQTTEKQTTKEINDSGSSQNLLPPTPDDGSHFGEDKSENAIPSDKVNIEMNSDVIEQIAEVETKDKHVDNLMFKTKESVEENSVQDVKDLNIAIKEEMGLSIEKNTNIGKVKDKNTKSYFKQESMKKSDGNESGIIDYKNEKERDIIGIEEKYQTLKSEKNSIKSDDKKETQLKPKLDRSNTAPRKPVKYASNGQSDPKGLYYLMLSVLVRLDKLLFNLKVSGFIQ